MACPQTLPRDRPAPASDALRPLDLLSRSVGWVMELSTRASSIDRGLGPELGNRLVAYSAFRDGVRRVSQRSTFEIVLRDLDGAPDAYRTLWRLEGAGYGWGEQWLEQGTSSGARPVGLGRSLPRWARLPLHTGVGLALATHLLLDVDGAQTGVGPLVARFGRQCEEVAAPGWVDVVFEELGFAVRLLRSDLDRAVDRALASVPRRRALFWHGVGRGLYFAPGHLWSTGRDWPALREACSGTEDPLVRHNRVAGLAWALTLVNLRHPRVVEARWRREVPAAVDEPFRFGVATALRAWAESHGFDEHLARFLRYEEPTAAPGTRSCWRTSLGRFLGPRAGVEELFVYTGSEQPGEGVGA